MSAAPHSAPSARPGAAADAGAAADGSPVPYEPAPAARARVRALLRSWVEARVPAEAAARIRARETDAASGPPARFFMEFSAVWRDAPAEPLAPGAAELAAAAAARPRWDPSRWTVRDAARVLLVLARDAAAPPLPDGERDALFRAADVGEAGALYAALPVLPSPATLVERCAEGVRTNVTRVLAAIAHHNPYPAERLPEGAWNQMVLKCLFTGLPLGPVQGLDARANAALSRMLVDFARERRSAGRPVPADLWRAAAPRLDDEGRAEAARAAASGDPDEAAAARAALAHGGDR